MIFVATIKGSTKIFFSSLSFVAVSRDSVWKKSGFGDKHPGSATLVVTELYVMICLAWSGRELSHGGGEGPGRGPGWPSRWAAASQLILIFFSEIVSLTRNGTSPFFMEKTVKIILVCSVVEWKIIFFSAPAPRSRNNESGLRIVIVDTLKITFLDLSKRIKIVTVYNSATMILFYKTSSSL